MESATEARYFCHKYLETAFIGAFRGVSGLIIGEHPLEYLRTHAQITPHASISNIFIRLFQKHGLPGFYSGFIPNAAKTGLKQSYLWPLMLALSSEERSQKENKSGRIYQLIRQTLAGFTIAFLESIIISPFEKMKIRLMTKQSQYIVVRTSNLWGEFNAVFAWRSANWISFLVAQKAFIDLQQERKGRNKLSLRELVVVGVFVGFLNSVAIMPFDVVKTHLQKEQPLPNIGVFRTMRSLVQDHGASILFRGFWLRFGQCGLQSSLTVPLFFYVQKRWSLEKLEKTGPKPG